MSESPVEMLDARVKAEEDDPEQVAFRAQMKALCERRLSLALQADLKAAEEKGDEEAKKHTIKMQQVARRKSFIADETARKAAEVAAIAMAIRQTDALVQQQAETPEQVAHRAQMKAMCERRLSLALNADIKAAEEKGDEETKEKVVQMQRVARRKSMVADSAAQEAVKVAAVVSAIRQTDALIQQQAETPEQIAHRAQMKALCERRLSLALNADIKAAEEKGDEETKEKVVQMQRVARRKSVVADSAAQEAVKVAAVVSAIRQTDALIQQQAETPEQIAHRAQMKAMCERRLSLALNADIKAAEEKGDEETKEKVVQMQRVARRKSVVADSAAQEAVKVAAVVSAIRQTDALIQQQAETPEQIAHRAQMKAMCERRLSLALNADIKAAEEKGDKETKEKVVQMQRVARRKSVVADSAAQEAVKVAAVVSAIRQTDALIQQQAETPEQIAHRAQMKAMCERRLSLALNADIKAAEEKGDEETKEKVVQMQRVARRKSVVADSAAQEAVKVAAVVSAIRQTDALIQQQAETPEQIAHRAQMKAMCERRLSLALNADIKAAEEKGDKETKEKVVQMQRVARRKSVVADSAAQEAVKVAAVVSAIRQTDALIQQQAETPEQIAHRAQMKAMCERRLSLALNADIKAAEEKGDEETKEKVVQMQRVARRKSVVADSAAQEAVKVAAVVSAIRQTDALIQQQAETPEQIAHRAQMKAMCERRLSLALNADIKAAEEKGDEETKEKVVQMQRVARRKSVVADSTAQEAVKVAAIASAIRQTDALIQQQAETPEQIAHRAQMKAMCERRLALALHEDVKAAEEKGDDEAKTSAIKMATVARRKSVVADSAAQKALEDMLKARDAEVPE
ncbi:hypothetical protein CYMTET_22062 [Cymbomonas tetramitiformis]|uniref:Uncharacterized protein n=1 Tax=Cymbomonas tetramitiformis TaxID=36881 RepID=A0AAE0L2N6_9CHLO|nr:hypothetical protein CYMTET_22062 [Cymbomonas tetramitiformis]